MATKDLKGNQKTVVQVFYGLLSGVILVVLKKCSSFGPVLCHLLTEHALFLQVRVELGDTESIKMLDDEILYIGDYV